MDKKTFILIFVFFLSLAFVSFVSGSLNNNLIVNTYFEDEINADDGITSPYNWTNADDFTTFATGKVGKAAYLNQSLQLNNTEGLSNDGNWTVSLWVKPDSEWNSGTGRTDIVYDGVHSPSGSVRLFYGWHEGNLSCIGYGDNVADYPTTLSADWHHILCSYDNNKIMLWLDGNNVVNKSVSGTATGIGSLVLHNGLGANFYADEFHFWNRSLNISEINYVYNTENGENHLIEIPGEITITLISPANNYVTTNSSLNFNATGSSSNNLSNATLYVWYNNGSLYNTNFTDLTNLNTNSTSVIRSLGGFLLGFLYKWNYYFCDISNLCGWADFNWTFYRGLRITTFNNSLTAENLTFTGNENITRYLDILRYANVTSAYLNLSGYGAYSINGSNYSIIRDDGWTEDILNTCSSCSSAYDNNWSTYASTNCTAYPDNRTSFYVYLNFTIPSNIANVSFYWRAGKETTGMTFECHVKLYCLNQSGNNYIYVGGVPNPPAGIDITQNHFLPSECFENIEKNVTIRVLCQGGMLLGSCAGNAKFYEGNLILYEGIYSNNSYLEIGTPDGTYEWSLRGAEFQGKNAILDELNDTSTVKNLTFTGDENQTVYLKIPKHANVTSAYLNLSGFLGYEFDDTEDEWGWGGNTTEENAAKCVDENWTTRGGTISTGMYETNIGYIYENFTIPSNIVKANWSSKFFTYNTGPPKVYYYNYSNSTFVRLLEDGYAKNMSIPGDGLTGDKLQIKSEVYNYDIGCYVIDYYEGAAIWFFYPNNPYLEIGTPDGTYEWNYSGEFNETFSPNKTSDFSSAINTYLSTCSADSENYCEVPLLFHSDTAGILQISAIEINYTNISKTPDLSSALNSALNSGACDCEGCILNGNNCSIPFLFHSDTAGILEYSDIQINYNSAQNVTLVSPANNSNVTSGQIFICNVSNALNLNNITLYIWNSTGDVYNTTTNSVSGTENETNFTIYFDYNDNMEWNCLSNDGEEAWADNNYTINVYMEYSKNLTQSFSINDIIKRIGSFPRDISSFFNLNLLVDRIAYFFRRLSQSFNLDSIVSRLRSAKITVTQLIKIFPPIEKTYDFSGVFYSQIFNNSVADIPPLSKTPAGETEIDDYTNISASDDKYITFPTDTGYPYYKFEMAIEEIDPDYVDVLLEGHTSSTETVYLYVWNYTANNWSLIDSGSGTTDFNLTARLYDLNDIRQGTGNVTFLVQSKENE